MHFCSIFLLLQLFSPHYWHRVARRGTEAGWRKGEIKEGGFLTWFVFLCLFILGALTWQQADWRLWTGNCNRAKSAAKSQLKMPGTGPIYLSLCCQTRIVHFQYTTHIFPFKPPAILELYCRRCKITCFWWFSPYPVTGALRDNLTRDHHHSIFMAIN